MNPTDNLAVNCIKMLSIEAIQKAKSGHPGITMGAAPMAYELWKNHLKHSPSNPDWITATDLFFPQVTVLCFCILCYTFLVMV